MRALSTRPDRYIPVTVKEMKAAICAGIAARVDRDQLTARQIEQVYPSVRAGDIYKIKSGDGGIIGVNRLVAIAEAIGVEISLEVSA